mgnify:CR=1 FL=1
MAQQTNEIELILKELSILEEHERVSKGKEKEFFLNAKSELEKKLGKFPKSLVDKVRAESKKPGQVNVLHKTRARELEKKPERRIQRFYEFDEGDEERQRKRSEAFEKKELKEIRKRVFKKERKVTFRDVRKPNLFLAAANRIFRNLSNNLVTKGHFKELHLRLKQSSFNILLNSYLSLMFFTTFLAIILGIIIVPLISVFSFDLQLGFPPILVSVKPIEPLNILRNLSIYAIALPLAIFVFLYFLPSIQLSGRRTRIENELPFAISHMSAIAGSGVEPSRIFNIIGDSTEYKEFNIEAQKVVNRVNLYGFDLITALKDVAKITPSPKVKDLFNGMATSIATGGDLKEYLEKKAEDSLTDYKLQRRKQSSVASLYADIYTGLLVAAPLIFGVILAITAPLGGQFFGISISSLAFLGMSVIIVINIIFLIFLNVAQPAD